MNTKELTVKGEYAIMSPSQNIVEIIQLNLGGEALSISDLDQIKTPSAGSTVWTIPTIDGEESAKEFEGIIIHSQIQRIYWENPFSGGGSPPDCYSNDAITGIGTPGGECSKCPKNQFGTASNKGRGKACSTKRIIFFIRRNNLLPTVLRVPVGSLKNSRKYLAGLASENKKVYSVYTKFGLEKDKNKDGIEFSKITFSRIGSVEDIEKVEKYVEAITPYITQAAHSVDPIPEEVEE